MVSPGLRAPAECGSLSVPHRLASVARLQGWCAMVRLEASLKRQRQGGIFMPRILIAPVTAAFLAAPVVFGPAMLPSLSGSAQAAADSLYIKMPGVKGGRRPLNLATATAGSRSSRAW
jgi:hypothetical protein